MAKPATTPGALPPHWRAIKAEQINIVVRVGNDAEPVARDVLSQAGFAVRPKVLRDDDGTPLIEMTVLAPPEDDQIACDFANEVLRATGIESQLVMHPLRKPRPGYAYHQWRRLLAGPDLPALNRDGRPDVPPRGT